MYVSVCGHIGLQEASTWAWGIVQACFWLTFMNFPLSLAQGLSAVSHLEPGALWRRRWKPHGHRLVRLHPGGPHPSVSQDSILVTASPHWCCPAHLPRQNSPSPVLWKGLSVGGPRSSCPNLGLPGRALVSRPLVGRRLQAPLAWFLCCPGFSLGPEAKVTSSVLA